MSTEAGMNRSQPFVDKPHPRGAASPAADARVNSGIDGGVLFEALICDLHWTMLHVGALGQLSSACLRTRGASGLRPWRHLLHSNSAAAILTLRYAPDFGMSAQMAANLTHFEEMLARLQAQTLPLTGNRNCVQTSSLSSVASAWRDLAQRGASLLLSLQEDVSRRLPVLYGEDSRTLVQFLRETVNGDMRRVNACGEISLPTLKQRRRNVRAPAEHACEVWVNGQPHEASVSNLSLEGLGIVCRSQLAAGQAVEVAIGRRRLAARVVWSDGAKYGLQLVTPLRRDDPLAAHQGAGVGLD